MVQAQVYVYYSFASPWHLFLFLLHNVLHGIKLSHSRQNQVTTGGEKS